MSYDYYMIFQYYNNNVNLQLSENFIRKYQKWTLPVLSSRGRFNLESWIFCRLTGLIFAAIYKEKL